MSKLQEDNQVNLSPSPDSVLMDAVNLAQSKSVEYQSALKRLEELKSSPQALSRAIHERSKTSDEICPGCGHPASRHWWRTGYCLGRIPHPGANPGSSHCRCDGFGDGGSADGDYTDALKSTMPDRRDNRDPEQVWVEREMLGHTRKVGEV